jgi:hypothetical protein
MVPLVLEDDLGQRHRGQVLAAGRVDDGDLLAGADHLFDLLEGHVPALLSIVELAVGVPLDHVRHGGTSDARSLTPRVTTDKTARCRLRSFTLHEEDL